MFIFLSLIALSLIKKIDIIILLMTLYEEYNSEDDASHCKHGKRKGTKQVAVLK